MAVPFGTLVVVIVLWFVISLPLVFLGAYLGFRKGTVCCSVLQCSAVCVAVCGSVLQCVAESCCVQCVAVCYVGS